MKRWIGHALVALAVVATVGCGGSESSSTTPLAIDLNAESTLGDAGDADGEEEEEDSSTASSGLEPVPTSAPAEEPAATPDPEPAEAAEPTATPEGAEPTPAPTPTQVPDGGEADDDELPLAPEQVRQVEFVGTTRPVPEGVSTPLTDPGDFPDVASPAIGTLDAPESMGTPFVFRDRASLWEVTLHGVLAGETIFASDDGSTCWFLVGSATVLYHTDQLATRGIDFPELAAIVDDELVDSGGTCEEDPMTQAGYYPAPALELATGASADFFVSLIFEDTADPAVQAIVVGDPDDDQASYFAPTTLTALPPLVDRAPVELPDTPSVVDAVVVSDEAGGWALRLHGLYTADAADRLVTEYGEGTICLVAAGEAFPIGVVEGSLSNFPPSFDVLADGQLLRDTITSCNVEAFEQAGYRWTASSAQTPGTPFGFIEAMLVPARLVDSVTHLVIGEFGPGEPVLLSAELVETLPPLPAVPADPLLPVTAGPMDAGPWTWTSVREQLTWQVEVPGMVDLGPTRDETGRCMAIVGTMTPSVAVDKGFQGPDFFVIADGSGFDALHQNCDTSSLEEAGYGVWDEFELDAGEPFAFFAPVQIPNEPARRPGVVVIGTPTRDGQAIYLDPVRLDAIPAIG